MYILSQAAIVIFLVLIMVVFLALLRSGGASRVYESERSGCAGITNFWRHNGRQADHSEPMARWRPGEGTMLLPMLCVDQLNPRTMKSVKRFQVCRIPENGVTISRPDARTNGEDCILLSDSTKEAYTVSAGHARIGIDDAGIFIQDCGSHNKMYRDGKATDETDITDGLVVYLGMQPLRFTIPGGCPDGGTEDSRMADSAAFSRSHQSREHLSFARSPVRRRTR